MGESTAGGETTGGGESTGGEESADGIRASDAERDATVDRLSAATGDGRLTLEEFSQRMDRATTAKTRAELDRLVADLPAEAGPGTGVAAPAAAGPSWHISPIGGLSISGPWRMDRQVIVVSIIGGASLDLSQAQLAAPEVTLTKVSLVGGVQIEVPAGIRVEASGFSLIGGTRVEAGPDPGPGAPTVHVRAFSLVGGVRISRSRPPLQRGTDLRADGRSQLTDRRADRWSRRADRRARLADRRADRRSRRDRYRSF